jgi:uroporphyrinogen-III decarboxylase
LILGAECYLTSWLSRIFMEIHQPNLSIGWWRPVIVFEKDVGSLLKWEKAELLHWVDWTCSPRNARYLLVETLQGNFDPSRLLSPFR